MAGRVHRGGLDAADAEGPEEEIDYFYSGGLWSIAEDGQFISDEYVTTYYRGPDTGEMYLDYARYSGIQDIDVA